MAICIDTIKTREICFIDKQAEDAVGTLCDVQGISQVKTSGQHRICIAYDIRELTLQKIETALTEVGFRLDTGLIQTVKRTLYAYCEDAQRERLGISESGTKQPTISLPQHFTQDPRPDNWRHYT